MDKNKEELTALLIKSVRSKKVLLDFDNKEQKMLHTERFFNTNTILNKPKIIYKYMELGILPVETRPDILLFYNSGESIAIEIVTEQDQLNLLINKKYFDQEEQQYKYHGDYRYLLCGDNIDTESVPDSWGILKIDMVEKKNSKTVPYVVITKPAKYVEKNFYAESNLLINSYLRLYVKLKRINKISTIKEFSYGN